MSDKNIYSILNNVDYKKKIAIIPYGKMGKEIENIISNEMKHSVDIIIDNNYLGKSEKILKLSDVENVDNYCWIICTKNLALFSYFKSELVSAGVSGMQIIDPFEMNEKITVFEKNIKYKNIHDGERCFILGNGPSLRQVDFEDLKDEFVFTVNNFAQVPNYKKLKTNVHLWADLSFFELRNDQKYNHDKLIENYRMIAEENPICFFPYQAFDFIENNSLNNMLNVNYYNYYDDVNENDCLQMDLTKYLTGFSTVVQYAIAIAAYMGFKKIYLLGCDTTNIIAMLNCALNISNKQMHAYDNDDVDERYTELLKQWTMTDVFYDQYTVFLGYKRLKEYCDQNEIVLINCSSTTLINEIPRMDLAEVII